MADQNSKAGDDNRVMTASENLARILGVVFIVVGVALIIALIGGFIVTRLPYRVDPNLPIPTLDSIEAYTKEDSIDISGSALPGEEVVLFQDGSRLNSAVETDQDGDFIFEDVEIDEEGESKFETAVVRGGIFKRRSEYSNEIATIVDWTPPSTTVTLDYEKENSSGKATVKGTAEANSTLIVEGKTKTYEVDVDENGKFETEISSLVKGNNEFSLRVKDRAGNEVIASTSVTIAYNGNGQGDINGPGASTGPNGEQLPESAGELDAAMEILVGNNAMLIFGFAAIIVFGLSSSAAYLHSRRNS